MIIHAIIPARSGSKGIKDKNIKNYCGNPLISYSIERAKECKLINRIIVSTDCEKYKEIAEKWGAEVPFLRPVEISGDLSTDYEFVKHYLDNIDEIPDIIVQLRPTYPNRTNAEITKAIELFINNFDKYDSLRSVIKIDKSPYKMYHLQNNKLIPYFNKLNNTLEPYNLPRQILPTTYLHNGYIDIIKTECLLKKKSITGEHILPYIMFSNEIDDIDTESDLIRSSNKLSNKY